MPINFALLDQFAAATKSTSGQTFAGYIGNGNTSAMILFDPKCDPNDPVTSGGLFALAYDTFTDKATGVSKRRPKFIVLAIIAAADDPKGLPKGWNGDFSEADSTVKDRVGFIKAERVVVPLAISATMKDALIDAIQANLSPVDIDGETGRVIRPTEAGVVFAVRLKRTGERLDTKYTAQPYSRVSKAEATVFQYLNIALLPEKSIVDIAADYTQHRESRNDNATAQVVAPPPKSLSSVAADLGDDELMDLI